MQRIFVIGDSISLQYGPHLESYLSGKFAYDRKRGSTENLDAGLGANGGDSRNVLAYVRQRLAARDLTADFVVINCGLHDIKVKPGSAERQVGLVEYEANLREIVRDIRTQGMRLIWVRTTPVDETLHQARISEFSRYGADVDRYNGTADTVMAEFSVPTIDLHHFTLRFMPGGLADHVHFNEDVRRLQAAFIAGALEQIISVSRD
jgi:lysophospholipase L1-like esterase